MESVRLRDIISSDSSIARWHSEQLKPAAHEPRKNPEPYKVDSSGELSTKPASAAMAPKAGEHFLAGRHIIVAGGGIAGTAFVSALIQQWDSSQQQRPEITIFERAHSRETYLAQDPYTLNLNGDNRDEGLVALQRLGLLESIRANATLNSGAIRVWSDKWKELASLHPQAHPDLPAATMRITRQNLKRILIESVEKKTNGVNWRWASTVTSAERLSTGQIRVTIVSDVEEEDNISTSMQDCDLLIAADGVNSRIRASLRPHDMKLEYTGATQIGGISHLPDGLPALIREDYGLQMSSGEGVCCIYTPFDDNTIGWALSTMGPERKAKTDFTAEEFVALKNEALKTATMFQEPFRSVVEATDPATAFVRPAMEKQAFQHDARTRGVVFIGDANHVLSPYEIVGANLALNDGWDLAEQICKNGSIEAAVEAYGKLSVARFEKPFKFSHERVRFGHSTGMLWKMYKYGMAAQRAMSKH
ncbi:hypothetical protein LTR96_000323 [Exophiala xenobiotica]|nr:hypothetical protein LTR41_005068 [Exophiala xenobiotica]KAK5273723.1 hypothetical protein LTR96_000323 [Exophiala xenobiotica]KAK5378093.1 hypothetical protein LTS03_004969 [Exophiala xenobiotica]KAK5389511.1 hypothetical protein LTR11_000321 [Exophiala xenobiotica]